MTSARNRELLALDPGVAAADGGLRGRLHRARRRARRNVSLTYGAIFLGLCLAAHIVLRFTLPVRRPVPVPALRACWRASAW